MIKEEETAFGKTLRRGAQYFMKKSAGIPKGGTLDGAAVFELYDAFGYPVDLTELMAEEVGINVDTAGCAAPGEDEPPRTHRRPLGGYHACPPVQLYLPPPAEPPTFSSSLALPPLHTHRRLAASHSLILAMPLWRPHHRVCGRSALGDSQEAAVPGAPPEALWKSAARDAASRTDRIMLAASASGRRHAKWMWIDYETALGVPVKVVNVDVDVLSRIAA